MKFKIFNDFWDNQPNHLPLLNLRIDLSDTKTFNLGKSLGLIDTIISNNSMEDIFNDIKAMLSNSNWRLHIVTLVTILKLKKSDQSKFSELLWRRLCLDTWVSPQLLVTLSIIDCNFKEIAESILKDKGLDTFRLNYLNEKELSEIKHISEIVNNKLLNSLRYLNTQKYLIDINDDNGAETAKNWNDQLIELDKLKLIKN